MAKTALQHRVRCYNAVPAVSETMCEYTVEETKEPKLW